MIEIGIFNQIHNSLISVIAVIYNKSNGEVNSFMKKIIFGCTLLIMGTIFAYSFAIAVPFWIIGSIFVLMGFADNKSN